MGSLFKRLNLTEEDGSPISIKTHAFRHYLNTLAQQGGLSQIDIAKWSGRKDIRQNAAYDHVTATALLARVQEAVGGTEEFYGALEPVRPHAPTLRSEFARLAIKTAHTTDFGYCIHDFIMAPCDLHMDCINCIEHVCVKGDPQKTSAIRQRLEEARILLIRSATAASKGHAGANRWEDHHRLTIDCLEKLVDVLNNPSVPSGSLVRMNGIAMVSRIAQAESARAVDTLRPAHEETIEETPDELDERMLGWETEYA